MRMISRLSLAFCAALIVLAGNVSAEEILGTERTVWEGELPSIGKEYTFSPDFLDKVKSSEESLEARYNSEHFEKVGQKKETVKEKRRKNPLLHRRPQKAKSSYVLDLKLTGTDHNKLIRYIPKLGRYYSEKHIALILPYIALCINYDVPTNTIDYYIDDFLDRETPPDIACDRLYRLAAKDM